MKILIDIFSKELRDSYLTTVVEQVRFCGYLKLGKCVISTILSSLISGNQQYRTDQPGAVEAVHLGAELRRTVEGHGELLVGGGGNDPKIEQYSE